MQNSWSGYATAPLEFFQSKLMELFHDYRLEKVEEETEITINGTVLNKLIAKAKMETYKKYPKQVNSKAIPTSEL